MNYRKIYEDIIRRAKERPKPNCYTERHHIVPKSLGGSNEKSNIAILTAREHFLCHWLLIKMFAKGTMERNKMLLAFFFMRSEPFKESNRMTNRRLTARVYEKYKAEYSESASKRQSGKCNFMFSKMWYTNINDGSSRAFDEDPGPEWIRGRNKLNGQSCSIKKIIFEQVYKDSGRHWYKNTKTNESTLQYEKPNDDWVEGRVIEWHKVNKYLSPITITVKLKRCRVMLDNKKHRSSARERLDRKRCQVMTDNKKHWSSARERWNRFHSGNWKSLSDFDKTEGRSPMASRMMFTKMIPLYKSQSKSKYRRFRSDKSLIGKYE